MEPWRWFHGSFLHSKARSKGASDPNWEEAKEAEEEADAKEEEEEEDVEEDANQKKKVKNE